MAMIATIYSALRERKIESNSPSLKKWKNPYKSVPANGTGSPMSPSRNSGSCKFFLTPVKEGFPSLTRGSRRPNEPWEGLSPIRGSVEGSLWQYPSVSESHRRRYETQQDDRNTTSPPQAWSAAVDNWARGLPSTFSFIQESPRPGSSSKTKSPPKSPDKPAYKSWKYEPTRHTKPIGLTDSFRKPERATVSLRLPTDLKYNRNLVNNGVPVEGLGVAIHDHQPQPVPVPVITKQQPTYDLRQQEKENQAFREYWVPRVQEQIARRMPWDYDEINGRYYGETKPREPPPLPASPLFKPKAGHGLANTGPLFGDLGAHNRPVPWICEPSIPQNPPPVERRSKWDDIGIYDAPDRWSSPEAAMMSGALQGSDVPRSQIPLPLSDLFGRKITEQGGQTTKYPPKPTVEDAPSESSDLYGPG